MPKSISLAGYVGSPDLRRRRAAGFWYRDHPGVKGRLDFAWYILMCLCGTIGGVAFPGIDGYQSCPVTPHRPQYFPQFTGVGVTRTFQPARVPHARRTETRVRASHP